MTTTAEATAAPREVKIGGRKFRMSPLRDRDYGEFEAWVQDRSIDLVKRNLNGLNEVDRQRQLDRAFDAAAQIGIHSDEALAAMCTIDGVSKLVWMGLRREHPDVTEDEVTSLLTSPEHVKQALDEVDRVNHMRAGRSQKKVQQRRRDGRVPIAHSRRRTGGRRHR